MAATTSGLTRAEALERAQAIKPALARLAPEGEKLRRLPNATVAELRNSGLLRLLQPKRFGGHQLDVHTHLDVVATLAEADSAAGWCAGVVHAHTWMSAHLSERAQAELYGANPDAITCAVVAPWRSTATRVDGGYSLSGFWPFGSGCEHSQWMFLGGQVKDTAGAVTDEGEFLVPTRDLKINDDWNVAGLRGTGSCSVTVKDLFVPDHRFLPMGQLMTGSSPGLKLHDGWLYKGAPVPVLDLALCGPAIGIARGALAAFRAFVPGRVISYTDQVQAQSPLTHIDVADASIRIDTAELLLHRCAEDVEVHAKAGKPMSIENRARARMDCAHAVRQCLEAVELLYLSAGGSALQDKSPIQRAQRDIHAVNMHGFLSLRTNQEMYGRILLGMPPNTPLI